MAVTAVQTESESKSAVQLDTVNNETTRVFVSGLPPKITSTQLAEHFGSKYKVTDAHVFADRRIGFVGFRDAATAKLAVQHFNRSYIRMSKISADLAKPVQLSRDSSGNAIPKSDEKRRGARPQLSTKRKRSKEDEGDHLRGAKDQASVQTDTARPQEQQQNEGEDERDPEVEQSKTQDNDWLRGKTSRTLDLEDPQEAAIARPRPIVEDDDEMQMEEQPEKSVSQDLQTAGVSPPIRTAVPNARLFLRNLDFDLTEQDLRSKFSEFGKVQEVHIVKDKRSASSKGTAYIQFAESPQAEDALAVLDGTSFQGRLLHILPSSDKREKSLTDYDISQMPLKKQKAVRRKLEASRATFSWNSLYMNPDAVVSSIADRLGVSKADILDPTSADAAVKQAHAETQLIKETKDYLAASGVNVDAFKHRERDTRVLLLKNFPYGTTEAELRALAEPYGSITRFILPPAGTMAIVQYDEPMAASQALKSLAYKNVKGSVLYMEKAPVDIMTAQTQEIKAPETALPATADDRGPTTTVFVRNLNFSTTSARLTDLTKALPGFVKAHVKTRTDAKKPGQVLSMGFGFVDFDSKSSAEAAVVALDKHSLDGHELVVQLSSKPTDAAEETRQRDAHRKKGNQQTKIIIKNLPFQVSKKDIRSLFAQYGQLKMVRVPRKFDNTARGFAFAEFVTPKEAESAMEALSNTHLLGRRLVLEYAEGEAIDPEEEIRAIERKVEQQSERVNFSRLTGSTRKKFNIDSAQDDDVS